MLSPTKRSGFFFSLNWFTETRAPKSVRRTLLRHWPSSSAHHSMQLLLWCQQLGAHLASAILLAKGSANHERGRAHSHCPPYFVKQLQAQVTFVDQYRAISTVQYAWSWPSSSSNTTTLWTARVLLMTLLLIHMDCHARHMSIVFLSICSSCNGWLIWAGSHPFRVEGFLNVLLELETLVRSTLLLHDPASFAVPRPCRCQRQLPKIGLCVGILAPTASPTLANS